jgi:hypothetical protein
MTATVLINARCSDTMSMSLKILILLPLQQVSAQRLSSRGRTQLRYTQVVDNKPAGSARVQRFVGRRRCKSTRFEAEEHTRLIRWPA